MKDSSVMCKLVLVTARFPSSADRVTASLTCKDESVIGHT